MPTRLLTLFLLMIAATAPGRAEWLAVIDRSMPESSGLSEDQLILLSQVARGIAGEATPDSIRVLSEENTFILLEEAGIDPADCEGQCEIDIARQLQADWLLSTQIVRFGSNWTMQLNLFRTESGELVASEIRGEAREENLVESARRGTRALFRELFAPPTPAVYSADSLLAPPIGVYDWLIDSRPREAHVILDGLPAGQTPLQLELEPGPHRLRLELAEHEAQEREILVHDDGAELFLMQALPGVLELESRPTDLPVRLDGLTIGSTPLRRSLDAGSYTLEVGDPKRHQVRGMPLRIQAGETQRLSLEVDERLGRLAIAAMDRRERSLSLPVNVDGKQRGRTPLTLSLPPGDYRVKVGDSERQARVEPDGRAELLFRDQKKLQEGPERMGTIGVAFGQDRGRLDWIRSHGIHEDIGFSGNMPGVVIHLDLLHRKWWALAYRHEGFWTRLSLRPPGKSESRSLDMVTHGSSLALQYKLDRLVFGGLLGRNWEFTVKDEHSVRHGYNWLGLQAGLRKFYLEARRRQGETSLRVVWLF